jgi:hypothetical protein
VVTLSTPEEQHFSGKTLEGALAWCLVRLIAPELGIGPFLVDRAGNDRALPSQHCCFEYS